MSEITTGLIIVDAQRGFMPASEGTRLQMGGFGELGIEGGETIVSPINRLTHAFQKYSGHIATTQDWHPLTTAHFSNNPNYVTSWPVHCVGNTTGAELHPELLVAQDPQLAQRFIKGDKVALTPEDDTSYTGALAYNPLNGETLPEWMHRKKLQGALVVGLALGDGAKHPLCVDSTAIDLHDAGFTITVIKDAVEAVVPQNRNICFENLEKRGITIATTGQALATIANKEQ